MSSKLVVVAVAILVFVVVVSPAAGVPSVAKVYRTAKKALKSAAKANKVAKRGVVTRTVDSGDVPAPPLGFAQFVVKCPAGSAPTGPSLGLGALEIVAVLAVPQGYIGSYFNPSDSTAFTGNLGVICAKGSWAGTARATRSRAEAKRQLAAAERDARAAVR